MFSTGPNAVCDVDQTGMVTLKAVGTCVITISQPGAVAGNESNYKAAANQTLTITIAAIAPSAPVLSSVTPGNGKLTVKFVAPATTGGGANLSYLATAVAGGTSLTCTTVGTTCEITGLTNDVSYTVSVVASSDAGSSAPSNSVTATPFDRANAPQPLVATAGNRQVALSWSKPVNIDDAVERQYEILGRVKGVGSLVRILLTAALTGDAGTSYTVTQLNGADLTAGTEYEFQVRAITKDGDTDVLGDLSGLTSVSTFAAPSAPRNLTLIAGANGTANLTISWLTPINDGGSAITRYVVTLNPGGLSCEVLAPATSCVISNLTAGTSYSATVVAVSDIATGTASSAVTATTINVPGSSVINSVTANNDAGSATINFAAAAATGGSDITSYIVRAYQGATAVASCTVVPVGAGPFSCTITGLSYKTDYTFKVSARNIIGAGAESSASSSINLVRTQSIEFTAPANINFNTRSVALVAAASSGLTVSFTSSTTSVCTVTGAQVSVLTVGTCSITASQSGAGTAFAAATAVTRSFEIAAVTPDAPTLISVVPGAAALTINFTQVTNLGGSTATNYLVAWATDPNFADEQTATVASNLTSYQITGLNPNQNYSVRIKVITAAIAAGSAWSNLLQGSTFGTPSAPRNVSAAAGIGGVATPGAVSVSWDVSLTTGGTPITGYRAQAMEGAGVPAVGRSCTTAGTSCVITGLDGSKFYTFEVVAINAVGESAAGEYEIEIQPGATQTITVAATTITTPSSRKRIELGASVNSGLPLRYEVKSQTKQDPAAVGDVCVVNSTTGVVTLNLAGSCEIEITQSGLDANNLPSAYLAATPVTVTVTVTASSPSNAKNLIINSADGALILSWEGPDDNGGRPIKEYEVTWFNSTVAEPSDATLETSRTGNNQTPANYGRIRVSVATLQAGPVTIAGLTNGTVYTIVVLPINEENLKGPRS